jgi:hypothetical protein
MRKTIDTTQKLPSKVTAHSAHRMNTATRLVQQNQKNWLSEATAQTVAILHNPAQKSTIQHNS